MNILDFDHTEHEQTLDMLNPEMMQDFKTHMESSFESLLFLGKNILNKKYEGLLNSAIFNIQLLFVYYKRTENYERLAQLKRLADDISSESRIVVDREIIDQIHVNLN
jgi:hypothetical protein